MKKKNSFIFTGWLLCLSLLLCACQSATPSPTEGTLEPTEPPKQCTIQDLRSISTGLTISNLFAWSHDGKFLAYLAPTETSSYNIGKLTILSGKDLTQSETIYNNVIGGILWSPNDSYIAFDTYSISKQTYSIFLHSIENDTDVEVYLESEIEQNNTTLHRRTVAWLSDSMLLSTSSCGIRCHTPFVYYLNTQMVVPFSLPTENDVNPNISGNSGMAVTAGGYYSILGVIADGGDTPQWIAADSEGTPVWENYYTFYPEWMLDSTHVYYLKQPYNPELPYEFRMYNPETGDDTYIFHGVVQAVFSPQKDRVAVISLGEPTYDEENGFIDFNPSARNNNQVGMGIFNLADGQLLGYEDLGTTGTKYVWQNPYLSLFSLAWSQDGEYVIYPDRYGNAYLYSIKDGMSAQINLEDQTGIEVKWSPDGSMVAALLSNQHMVVLDSTCLK